MMTKSRFKGRVVLWDSKGLTVTVRGEKRTYKTWDEMARAVRQQNSAVQWKKKSARLEKWLKK